MTAIDVVANALTGAAAAAAKTVTMPVYYQPLIDQQLMANISWGTPAQEPIPTVLDTGSFAYWIFGPDAVVNSGSPYLGVLGPCNQTAEPAFDWHESSTHQGPFPGGSTFSYGGNGKLLTCPTLVNDTLNFPGLPPVPNTQAALCEFMLIKDRATTCSGAHYDKSIMGLAKGNLTAGPYFRQDLEDTGLVEKSIYSFWFNKLPEDINEPQHGTLLLGDVPKDVHVGDVATVKNVVTETDGTPGLYYASMPEVFVRPLNGSGEGKAIPPSNPDNVPACLVDTGTWGLTLPTDHDAFFAATGLEEDSPFILPRYPTACEDIPRDATLDLRFTGEDGKTATVKVPYRNLAQGKGQAPNTCSLNLQLGDPACTFGGTFFTGALTVFNDEDGTMSFAQIPL